MENLKYIIVSILLLTILGGWYSTSNIISSFDKDRLLYNNEKTILLEHPDLNKWYYQKKTYNIIYNKSLIPFIYSSIDTTKVISTKYYITDNPGYYK